MHEAGYVGMDWPREFGGRGATIVEMVILYQEMARAESPQLVNRGGVSMLGPTLMKHGTAAQQQRHLAKILTADELWCQGFSEPNAGSDLANLQTRAVREGEHFVVNGQKVWTSMAHVADWCFLLVRTDPNAAKHRRSEEHTSELQSHSDLVCRLLLEKKKKKKIQTTVNKKKKMKQ